MNKSRNIYVVISFTSHPSIYTYKYIYIYIYLLKNISISIYVYINIYTYISITIDIIVYMLFFLGYGGGVTLFSLDEHMTLQSRAAAAG